MTTSSSTFEPIEKLLHFQNSFLNLVHSQVLSQQEGQKRKQALLKFQVVQISDKNEIFNNVISTLKRQLVEQKVQCEPVLKSYFLKLLELQYLPLLHVNRYELTKLSIFGFDIYIDPLQAILQILNRIQRILYILEDSLKDQQLSTTVTLLAKEKKPVSQILLKGWKEYYCFLHLYKLTLNVYMLKQETNIASTSLPKKDKEIIFTGVYNLYKRLIPILTRHHLTSVLEELADLNNNMYSFHPSFDYFSFYTEIQPIEENLSIFSRTIEIEKKCIHTNILTPLLFGVMNNYKGFQKFISSVESVKFVNLLRALLSGLIINFKLRILEYNQVLVMIGKVINKLSLLNKMKIQIITSDLSKEWKQAKDFFISAFKNGYNPGQIQTWTLCDSELIQPTILTFLMKGILLTSDFRNNQFLKTLQKQQLQELLQNEIKQLTDGNQTLNGLSNNWKKIDLDQSKSIQNKQNQQQTLKNDSKLPELFAKKVEGKCLNIVRIINILSFLEINSEKLIYAIVSALNSIKIVDSSLIKTKLLESIETLNELITALNRKEPLSNLTEVLPEFHKNYVPQKTFQDIIPVYFHSFIMREAVTNLIDIVSLENQQSRTPKIKQVLTAIVHRFFVKQQNQQFSMSYVIYKSFEKQYKIPLMVTEINPQTNSVFSNLVKIYTSFQTKSNKSEVSLYILINLLKHSPHHVIGVMNLPALKNEKIISFVDWLINCQNQDSKRFIIVGLSLLNQFADKNQCVNNGDLKGYLFESYYMSVLDGILNSLSAPINEKNQSEQMSDINKILRLIDLFIEIYQNLLKKSSHNQKDSDSVSVFPVWTNFIQLISLIFKNPQLKIQQVNKCSKIYWKILKLLKGSTITQWYHKLLINRIFSTLTSESLVFNQSFKGITPLSSIKNYLITKDFNPQFQQNTKEKPQRHAFSDIKSFFQLSYIQNKKQQNQQNQLKNIELRQIGEMRSFIIQECGRQRKIESYLETQRQIPPFLPLELLQKVYNQYCKSKLGNKSESQLKNESQQNTQVHKESSIIIEKESFEFSLVLLSLNPVNHRNLWQMIMKSQDKKFIQHLSFTRQTINQVLQVVKILQVHHSKNIQQPSKQTTLENYNTQKTNEHQKQTKVETQIKNGSEKSKTKSIMDCIKQMLGIDMLRNKINEIQLLASAYYFDANKLQTFLQYKEALWVLIVCNNTNWREFNQVFATYIKNQCFLSNLLQYKEYLSITQLTNDSYETKIEQFSSLIDDYTFYVEKKSQSINLLRTTDSEKENSIRKSTLLINIKMLLIKCEVQKILQKLKLLLRELNELSLLQKKHYRLIGSFHKLNKVCNKLQGGIVNLPTFMNHNLYTSSQSQGREFFLGRWIQDCEEVFDTQILQKQRQKYAYYPERQSFIVKNSLIQINNQNEEQTNSNISQQRSEDILRTVLNCPINKEECRREFLRLKQTLSAYLLQQQQQPDKVIIKHSIEPNNQSNPKALKQQFYALGYYHLIHQSQQNNQSGSHQNLSLILQNLTKREKISLNVLKQINPELFHHLKLLTINQNNIKQTQTNQTVKSSSQNSQQKQSSMERKQVGQQTISEKNTNNQIQTKAKQALGVPYFSLNQYFALGFLNASLNHQNK